MGLGAKDQLTQEVSSRTGGYTNNFGFDNVGNPTNFKGVAQTFNSNNQITSNSYDLNGNPTTYKGTNSSFDAENRMIAFGSSMTVGYFSEGLRAWKQNSSARTYFLYADGEIPVCELDASGNVTSTNTIGEQGLLSRRTTTSIFYAFDVQGSASHRMDSNGNTLSTSTFDSFGSRATNDSSGDPFAGFGGKYGYRIDSETGLQLLGQRYYEPSGGRFVTRDPIGYSGGINEYNYVENSPIGKYDPSGLAAIVSVWDPGVHVFPHHRFISLDKPCIIVPYKPITSIGAYPGRGINGWAGSGFAPLDPIVGGPADIRFPDPILTDPAFPIDGRRSSYHMDDQDTSPSFEAALCNCIKTALSNGDYWGINPPLGGNTPRVCFNFAWDLWDCAKSKTKPGHRRPWDRWKGFNDWIHNIGGDSTG